MHTNGDRAETPGQVLRKTTGDVAVDLFVGEIDDVEAELGAERLREVERGDGTRLDERLTEANAVRRLGEQRFGQLLLGQPPLSDQELPEGRLVGRGPHVLVDVGIVGRRRETSGHHSFELLHCRLAGSRRSQFGSPRACPPRGSHAACGISSALAARNFEVHGAFVKKQNPARERYTGSGIVKPKICSR